MLADKTILILSVNPSDTSRLRLDKEVREIQEGLQLSAGRDRFTVISQWAVRPRPRNPRQKGETLNHIGDVSSWANNH